MKELLRPYSGQIGLVMLLGLLSNGLGLVIPSLIGQGVDGYKHSGGLPHNVTVEFAAIAVIVLVLSYLQSLVQIGGAERVARDLRTRLVARVSEQSYTFVLKREPAKLLTHLTGDVDAIKQFVAQAIPSLLSSAVVLVGAGLLLLHLDAVLALVVLIIVPVIGVAFGLVIGQVRKLFKRSREITDRLNKIIQDSVQGAALIRVLHAGPRELGSFQVANEGAREVGLRILGKFASLIPAVFLVSNLATLTVLTLGGHRVIEHRLPLGGLAAFNGYLALLIFPIFEMGFSINIIGQAQASYGRIRDLLEDRATDPVELAKAELKGDVQVRGLSFSYGERQVLKDISLRLPAGTRTAIIGPTAAGKTQLLYLLMGLLEPETGEVLYDDRPLHEYDQTWLRRQVALVFQESILFRGTLRENVAFRQDVAEADWRLAVQTAELQDLIDGLPLGAETMVSERGTSLSGGQKQRVLLARALALRPRVLYLDDFTARLDPATERQVLANLRRNYPELTLLTVTQRIGPVQDYDHIVLMMEGAILAEGTHPQLLEKSPEYMQIYESQKSTQAYD
jgi:ATP-binding cassette subfamily B protein